MGSQERREKARQDVRQKILFAAREIITREGFEALTMRKLADRVEYSAASIYLHFRNRDHIAREVSRACYVDLFAAISTAVDAQSPTDSAARFKALCHAYVRFGIENPQTYDLIFMKDPDYLHVVLAEQSEDDAATRSYALLVQTAQDLISSGHSVGKAPAVELAETIWAALHGIVSLKLTCPYFPTASSEVLTTLMADTILRGLTPFSPGRTAPKAPQKRTSTK